MRHLLIFTLATYAVLELWSVMVGGQPLTRNNGAAARNDVTLTRKFDPPIAATQDSLSVYSRLTSADHQWIVGVFDLDDASLTVRRDTDLYRWLVAHRGQEIVLVVREDRNVR